MTILQANVAAALDRIELSLQDKRLLEQYARETAFGYCAGCAHLCESMVKGKNVLEAGTPLSFDVLCNEIRGLGLNIQLEKKRLGSTAL